MTIRYVGIGGSDANSGLTWALRKLTLNGAEDTPVVAGDIVYIGAGVYRELLTLDVAGTAGNPIEYIGDYTGVNTDGVGGTVRITGSDDDLTATRANCILANTTRHYRTFTNIRLDLTTGSLIASTTFASTNWIIQKCHFASQGSATHCIHSSLAGNTDWIIRNCLFYSSALANCSAITFSGSASNTNNLVESCIFLGGAGRVVTSAMGGVTAKNCVSIGITLDAAYRVTGALPVGQVFTVNNCIVTQCLVGMRCTTVAEMVENYNTFWGNATDRNTTGVGANSITYPPLFDARWFFQLVNAGAGPNSATQIVSPFDLASFSALLNVAGTSPTTTDMRGTAIQNTQREWGALEYDSTLSIKARQASSIDGGGMVA